MSLVPVYIMVGNNVSVSNALINLKASAAHLFSSNPTTKEIIVIIFTELHSSHFRIIVLCTYIIHSTEDMLSFGRAFDKIKYCKVAYKFLSNT